MTQVTTPNPHIDFNTILPIEIIHKENSLSLLRLKQTSINTDLTEWSHTLRIKALQEIQGHSLELSIINQKKTNILLLTPLGLTNSKRQVKDGVVYFGSNFRDSNSNIIIDYKLKLSNPIYGKKTLGPHFMVFFDLNKKTYFIRDLMVGLGTFVRVKEAMVLENDHLLSFGETYILVNIVNWGHEGGYPKLRLKVIGGNNFSEIFYFTAQEFYLSTIVVGRNRNCQVYIEDSTVSKQHASIFFSIYKQWVIIDGTANRNSLNGTWVFASKDIELTANLEIKACESVLKVLPQLCNY